MVSGPDFPFDGTGTAADGSPFAGLHTFTATFSVTDDDGDMITGIVEGGSNCEVAAFSTVGGHAPVGVFDFTHTDTNNMVCTALEITGGTGDLDGFVGNTGVLCFMYDTFEPHTLRHAHIVLDLDDDDDDSDSDSDSDDD